MSKTTKQVQEPPVVDPDNVPETLCDGPAWISPEGYYGIVTFTQKRPKAGALFKGGSDLEFVVRARIVMSIENLLNLRDALSRLLSDEPQARRKGNLN